MMQNTLAASLETLLFFIIQVWPILFYRYYFENVNLNLLNWLLVFPLQESLSL